MTAETDLLPLPMEAFTPAAEPAERRAAIRAYARACVSSATEALRAEVERLRSINSALCRKSNSHLIDAARWEERAERRAEALRWYANPEVYKPHPHGPAFDRRDLSFVARAALEQETTNG